MSGRPPVVAVCGFPRCGSTMVMAMLAAGGIPPAEGSGPASFEVGNVEEAVHRAPKALAGRALKVLDFALWSEPDDWSSVPWVWLWCDRDVREQARSHVKFMASITPEVALPRHAEEAIRESLVRDRPEVLARLRVLGTGVMMSYEDTLSGPTRAAGVLATFLGGWFPHFDPAAAARVVHERDGTCRPDLEVELAAVAREASQ